MTVKLYPRGVYDNPPTDFSSDVVAATEDIHSSIHLFGTNKDKLIKDLATKTAAKRLEIYYCYKDKYGKDLSGVIDDKVGGDLGDALQYLSMPLPHAEAHMLHRAMRGMGARERFIYQIVCGRTNEEIVKLKEAYFEIFNEDLGVRFSREFEGDFERLLFWSIQGAEDAYDGDIHTDEKAEEDADAFYKAGEGKWWGADEKSLFKIICTSPSKHLEKINEIYVSKHEKTLISAIAAETEGDVEKGAAFAIGMKLKPYETVAEQINEESKGLIFTDEYGLTCSTIRYQGILKEVSEVFEREHGKDLIARIKAKEGGKYERLLVDLVESDN